jgi:hypothetical protein
MMNKIQNPSNSEGYTPSSEPFRILRFLFTTADIQRHHEMYSVFLPRRTGAKACSDILRLWKFQDVIQIPILNHF